MSTAAATSISAPRLRVSRESIRRIPPIASRNAAMTPSDIATALSPCTVHSPFTKT